MSFVWTPDIEQVIYKLDQKTITLFLTAFCLFEFKGIFKWKFDFFFDFLSGN